MSNDNALEPDGLTLRGPLPSRHSDTFKHWHAKNVLPEAALLHSLAMAQDCVRLLQSPDLTRADEMFPRVFLEPVLNDDLPR